MLGFGQEPKILVVGNSGMQMLLRVSLNLIKRNSKLYPQGCSGPEIPLIVTFSTLFPSAIKYVSSDVAAQILRAMRVLIKTGNRQ